MQDLKKEWWDRLRLPMWNKQQQQCYEEHSSPFAQWRVFVTRMLKHFYVRFAYTDHHHRLLCRRYSCRHRRSSTLSVAAIRKYGTPNPHTAEAGASHRKKSNSRLQGERS